MDTGLFLTSESKVTLIYYIMLSTTSFLGGLFLFISIVADPLLFILQQIGIRYFIIRNDEDKVKSVYKVLEKQTVASKLSFQYGKMYPSGIFIGWNCVGYFTSADRNSGVSGEIHIFTTYSFFNKIIEENKVIPCFEGKPSVESHSIKVLSKSGGYSNTYYSSRLLEVSSFLPYGDQETIIKEILDLYTRKKRATVFLHGVCGAGKSTIGLLVAKEIKASFCHTFNPFSPGDFLHSLVRDAETEGEDPLVIVIEEVNTLIRIIHENKGILHKNVRTHVYNKSTFNTFLDDMSLFNNIILIITSNESKEVIDSLDPCYLRKGRVDLYYSMMRPLVLENSVGHSILESQPINS
jgi:hypothetical protein